jgi:hypothetical protein
LTNNQTYFSLAARNVSDETDISRSIEISERLHELKLSRRSRHQTIHLRIRFQREQWSHQLILKTSINRDAIYLWSRIYETNRRRKENYLITKSHDLVDMWCRISSNDNNIRRQSKNHCFDKEFSVSRANQTHWHSNSFYQKKSDRRIYKSSLRVHRSNDNWRFNQIIDKRQVCSISRRFKNRIASFTTVICESILTHFLTAIYESVFSES